jgi:hypothetical protein
MLMVKMRDRLLIDPLSLFLLLLVIQTKSLAQFRQLLLLLLLPFSFIAYVCARAKQMNRG